jgi:putative phage-type endonuclease
MKIHKVEQRSDEWHQLRVGRITGTKIKEMVTGKPATFETLCKKVAAEKLTGISCEKPFRITDAMQHGIDTEKEAKAAYELDQLVRIEDVGFIEKDDIFGCSPDGLVGENGGVEIKCPMSHTHLGYWLEDFPCNAYRWQLQGFLWITGREWVHFVSYCPDYPEEKRLLIQQVRAIPEDQAKIHNAAVKLEAQVAEILEAVK